MQLCQISIMYVEALEWLPLKTVMTDGILYMLMQDFSPLSPSFDVYFHVWRIQGNWATFLQVNGPKSPNLPEFTNVVCPLIGPRACNIYWQTVRIVNAYKGQNS